MLFLKSLLLLVGVGFVVAAVALVAYDLSVAFEIERLFRRWNWRAKTSGAEPTSGGDADPGARSNEPVEQPAIRPRATLSHEIRWWTAVKLTAIAALAALGGQSIVVVPDGNAGVCISQISGVLPGTLYAGTHFIVPLIDRIDLYDIRDEVFSTVASAGIHETHEVLTVEAREGLSIGLAVTVRYRIDPRRLDYIQANLPQPLEDQIVAPVVTSAFRELAPNYVVRDIFSVKREEFRQRASQVITQRLSGDAIVVKEVLLRKIDLPEEYAQGLEGLLLKEQQDEQTSVDADIEVKRIKIAASQAEAAKIREVKRTEALAQSRVIMAKAESDSMQYTLPLKQKQIEQSRLEAQAGKETTIENAQAAAEAKVIDSKAEQERQNLLAVAEANRIRVTSQAEAERLQLEAAALKANPLLVQLTVAQKLSDKVQIMMVPNDGKYFFANDVLRSAAASEAGSASDPPSAASRSGKP